MRTKSQREQGGGGDGERNSKEAGQGRLEEISDQQPDQIKHGHDSQWLFHQGAARLSGFH